MSVALLEDVRIIDLKMKHPILKIWIFFLFFSSWFPSLFFFFGITVTFLALKANMSRSQ